jgi:chaperonin GroES
MAEYSEDEELIEPIDGEAIEADEPEIAPAEKLMAFLDSPNLVTELTDEQLADIGHKAIEGYRRDDASRAQWKELNEAGMKLATLVAEEKNTPFAGAANVKAPLITTAALQFNSRAYPAMIKGDRVVKGKVNGKDPTGDKAKRAERVSEHSSWQMLSQMPEWEPDTDRLTLIVAITGVVFRKRYWDPTLNRQCSRLVLADRFVYNYKARSIEDCPRISEELYLYPYEIQERIRDGRFIEFDYGDAQPEDGEEADEDSPHLFIEQHRLSDLDGDGYPEPYIVTVHVETEKVCRIVPNFDADSVRVTPEGKIAAIRKRDYYTKYVFFESPDGGAYGMGLGSLMGSTTDTVNTLINEIIDAGHLANTQGGFINASAGLREKNYRFQKGELKNVNVNGKIQDSIMMLNFPGPSEVLFKALGLLMEFAKEISATADVMTGDTGGKAMAPTTTLALIEQGMQVFTAVFKRLHRALGRELEMHANLNAKHLSAEDYNAFFDDPQEQYDPKVDYDLKDMNITPVSDPTVATNMQKLAKSQVTREIATGKPYFNQMEVDKRALEAAEVPDIEGLFVPPQPPDPMAEELKKLTLQELFEKVIKLRSESIKNVADAESKEAGDQLALLNQFLSTLQAGHAMETQDNAPIPGGPGGLPSMAGPPGNAMGAGPLPPGGNGGGGGAAGPPAQQQPSVDPAAMGGTASPVGAPAGAM